MTNPEIVDNDELLNSRIFTFDINRSDGGWLGLGLGLGRSGPSRPFPWIHHCVMGYWLSLLMKWILFKLFTVWQRNNALLHLSLSCSDPYAFRRMNALSRGSWTASIHPATPWPNRLQKWLDSSIHPILLFQFCFLDSEKSMPTSSREKGRSAPSISVFEVLDIKRRQTRKLN